MDVCLVHMPYGAVEWPSIGIGLLIAAAKRAGISAKAVYPSLWFAESMGYERYFVFTKFQRAESGLADWTFAKACFPDFEPNHSEYLSLALAREEVLCRHIRVFGRGRADFRNWLSKTRKDAVTFVKRAARQVLDLRPRIVGCSTAFQQNCSSLALLRRIKESDPNIVTLMGGPSCEGEMGLAMKQVFPWVDYVVSGEADLLFADLCHVALAEGAQAAPKHLPNGVFSATNVRQISENAEKKSVGGVPTATVTRLDDLPDPDYEDYFEERRTFSLDDRIPRILLFETSRGCWKGNRRPCRFCGLNGNRRVYRSKKPVSVLDQLARLNGKYANDVFMATDTILKRGYFRTLLPKLSTMDKKYRLFFETVSTLEEREVARLAEAGIRWIQPGIETLSDEIAELLDKGNSALRSIALLKHAREQGVRCIWHILYRVPGDEESHYRDMISLLPLLHHLEPPSAGEIRFDRFSCYHRDPRRFGLTLEPYPTDAFIYPTPGRLLRDMTYFFRSPEMESRPERLERTYTALRDAIGGWQTAFWGTKSSKRVSPALLMTEDERSSTIKDTRACAVREETRLKGLRHAVHRLCRTPVTVANILEGLRAEDAPHADAAAVKEALAFLICRKLVVCMKGSYLALATCAPKRPLPGNFPREAKQETLLEWLADLQV
ncbi:MAG: RiPP maturation radical SAM C-methyltransferase [Planctomycetota bacterium]